MPQGIVFSILKHQIRTEVDGSIRHKADPVKRGGADMQQKLQKHRACRNGKVTKTAMGNKDVQAVGRDLKNVSNGKMAPENTCKRLYTTRKNENKMENIAFRGVFFDFFIKISNKNHKKLHIRGFYGLHFFRIYAILR